MTNKNVADFVKISGNSIEFSPSSVLAGDFTISLLLYELKDETMFSKYSFKLTVLRPKSNDEIGNENELEANESDPNSYYDSETDTWKGPALTSSFGLDSKF